MGETLRDHDCGFETGEWQESLSEHVPVIMEEEMASEAQATEKGLHPSQGASTVMTTRGATEVYKCKRCGDPFTARVADRKRGWARFCSKSCKAIHQEKRTGQHYSRTRNYLGSGVSKETYLHYQREHGGIPNFDRNGNYIGFQSGGFSNED